MSALTTLPDKVDLSDPVHFLNFHSSEDTFWSVEVSAFDKFMMAEPFNQQPLVESIKALQNSARPDPWASIVSAAKQMLAFLVNLRPGATSQLESLVESELA
eukprot:8766280-Alexandrium_andersonii.AAC.1